jgi:hypothetical protein
VTIEHIAALLGVLLLVAMVVWYGRDLPKE